MSVLLYRRKNDLRNGEVEERAPARLTVLEVTHLWPLIVRQTRSDICDFGSSRQ